MNENLGDIQLPADKEDFGRFVSEVWQTDGIDKPVVSANGIATVFMAQVDGVGVPVVLDVMFCERYFCFPQDGQSAGTAAVMTFVASGGEPGTTLLRLHERVQAGKIFSVFLGDGQQHPNIDFLLELNQQTQMTDSGFHHVGEVELPGLHASNHFAVPVNVTINDLDRPPVDLGEAKLRHQLTQLGYYDPRDISTGGDFGLMENVVWTNYGPVMRETYNEVLFRQRFANDARRAPMVATHIDKFARWIDNPIPAGVRVVDGNRVRHGARLDEGATFMPEGFANKDTWVGRGMYEGRVSAGVVVGEGTDLGGGSAISGVLSGGGTEVISVGERCLLGSNSVLGISLLDDCIVEAGLALMPGTKIAMPDGEVTTGRVLSGRANGLVFRRNSQTGVVEALVNNKAVKLNEALHAN